MKVKFVRWCMNAPDRTPLAVEPSRVDSVLHFSPAFTSPTGEDYPAASKIVMRGKQEYIVQGTVEEVTDKLNHEDVSLSDIDTMLDKFP